MCLQATLPTKPGIKNSTFKPYMWGVALAYACIAYCYFCVAFAGYWAFGNKVNSNIMLSVAHPTWLVAVANMLVVVHVFGSYQVNFCLTWGSGHPELLAYCVLYTCYGASFSEMQPNFLGCSPNSTG